MDREKNERGRVGMEDKNNFLYNIIQMHYTQLYTLVNHPDIPELHPLN